MTVNTPLVNGDVQALQMVTSANNLRAFVAQLALLEDSNANVQQDAQALANEARDFDLALHQIADPMGIALPADLVGADRNAAQKVLSAVGGGNFESSYLAAVTQAETELGGLLQQSSTGARNTSIRTASAMELPVVQTRLKTEAGLPSGSVMPTGAGSVTQASSMTLNSQDLQTLRTAYSTNLVERFLAQVTALPTRSNNVKLYAEKLISDHEQETVQLGLYAAYTGTSLPGSIEVSTDIQTAQKVLGALNSRRYDTVYLRNMVPSHTQDIMSNQQTLATSQNPNLLQFAMDDLGTDFLHRLGAQTLLRGRH